MGVWRRVRQLEEDAAPQERMKVEASVEMTGGPVANVDGEGKRPWQSLGEVDGVGNEDMAETSAAIVGRQAHVGDLDEVGVLQGGKQKDAGGLAGDQ